MMTHFREQRANQLLVYFVAQVVNHQACVTAQILATHETLRQPTHKFHVFHLSKHGLPLPVAIDGSVRRWMDHLRCILQETLGKETLAATRPAHHLHGEGSLKSKVVFPIHRFTISEA